MYYHVVALESDWYNANFPRNFCSTTQHTLTGHNNKVMAAKYLDDNAKVVSLCTVD